MGRQGTGENASVISSADLVRRVLEGETELFEALVRRHQREVYRVAAALLRDATGTENLVQQTFIKVFERLDRFDGQRDFGVWVKEIARNLAVDELRRSSSEAKHLGQYRDYLLSVAEEAGALDTRERRMDEALDECRRTLAPAAAQALALRYEDALEMEAVARALGRTVGATHQLLFRARLAIRQCLDRRLQPE